MCLYLDCTYWRFVFWDQITILYDFFWMQLPLCLVQVPSFPTCGIVTVKRYFIKCLSYVTVIFEMVPNTTQTVWLRFYVYLYVTSYFPYRVGRTSYSIPLKEMVYECQHFESLTVTLLLRFLFFDCLSFSLGFRRGTCPPVDEYGSRRSSLPSVTVKSFTTVLLPCGTDGTNSELGMECGVCVVQVYCPFWCFHVL